MNDPKTFNVLHNAANAWGIIHPDERDFHGMYANAEDEAVLKRVANRLKRMKRYLQTVKLHERKDWLSCDENACAYIQCVHASAQSRSPDDLSDFGPFERRFVQAEREAAARLRSHWTNFRSSYMLIVSH